MSASRFAVYLTNGRKAHQKPAAAYAPATASLRGAIGDAAIHLRPAPPNKKTQKYVRHYHFVRCKKLFCQPELDCHGPEGPRNDVVVEMALNSIVLFYHAIRADAL